MGFWKKLGGALNSPIAKSAMGVIGNLGGMWLGNVMNNRNIDRMNAYNHPGAQKARFGEAGMSESLGYTSQGSAGLQSSVATAAPSTLGMDAVNAYEVASTEQYRRDLLKTEAEDASRDYSVKWRNRSFPFEGGEEITSMPEKMAQIELKRVQADLESAEFKAQMDKLHKAILDGEAGILTNPKVIAARLAQMLNDGSVSNANLQRVLRNEEIDKYMYEVYGPLGVIMMGQVGQALSGLNSGAAGGLIQKGGGKMMERIPFLNAVK